MMNMVESVANDPLSPLQFDRSEGGGSGEYETRLLESTIEKLTGLLRVGFGEVCHAFDFVQEDILKTISSRD